MRLFKHKQDPNALHLVRDFILGRPFYIVAIARYNYQKMERKWIPFAYPILGVLSLKLHAAQARKKYAQLANFGLRTFSINVDGVTGLVTVAKAQGTWI